mgnify:CR=1 FL=1
MANLEHVRKGKLQKEEDDEVDGQVQMKKGRNNRMDETMGLVETVHQNYEALIKEKRKLLDKQAWPLKKHDSRDEENI